MHTLILRLRHVVHPVDFGTPTMVLRLAVAAKHQVCLLLTHHDHISQSCNLVSEPREIPVTPEEIDIASSSIFAS